MERIKKLQSFIAVDPTDLFSRHALGMELVKLGDYNAAIEQMENILSIDKNYIGTYYHLGKTYEKITMNDKAIDAYERGIQIAKQSNKEHELRELMGALNLLKDELS